MAPEEDSNLAWKFRVEEVVAYAVDGVIETKYITDIAKAIETITAIALKTAYCFRVTLNKPGFSGVGFSIGF